MASTYSPGVFAVSRQSGTLASTPPAATRLAITGTPAAMPSRILFCVPRAMWSGAIISAASCRNGRTSGTDPVTVTPGSAPSLRIAGDGLAPTIVSLTAGRSARSRGITFAQNSNMHCWLGK